VAQVPALEEHYRSQDEPHCQAGKNGGMGLVKARIYRVAAEVVIIRGPSGQPGCLTAALPAF